MDKESFLIYKSFYEPIKYLSNEKLGKLFRAIFEYQINDIVYIDEDIRMAFEFFKNQFRIDDEKYQKRIEANRENGKKGGRPKKTQDNQKNPMGKIKPKKADNDNDNDNVNDNDNGNDIHSDSKAEHPTPKEAKKKYGEYKHVLLKDSELEKLKEEYPNYEELITYLDEYIEMKGYKAKSHYLAIIKWVDDAVNEKKRNSPLPKWFNKENKESNITNEEKEELDEILESLGG